MTLSDWFDLALRATVALEKIADKQALPPPVLVPQDWPLVWKDDGFPAVPLNTEMPNAGDNGTTDWNPWVAGTGSADGNRNNASVQIVQQGSGRALQCRIFNTVGRNVGARAFLADNTRWTWWGTKFEGKTVRIKAKALYPVIFTLPNGEGTFAQTFWEFKTLDTPMTAVGVFLQKGADGKLYHYLSLAGKTFGLDQQTDPLVFGESLDYELEIEFKRSADAKVTFRYKNTVIEGVGQTLNRSNGQGGGAFLLYSNELTGTASVLYSDIEIRVKG